LPIIASALRCSVISALIFVPLIEVMSKFLFYSLAISSLFYSFRVVFLYRPGMEIDELYLGFSYSFFPKGYLEPLRRFQPLIHAPCL
jgi:hypothetical protein